MRSGFRGITPEDRRFDFACSTVRFVGTMDTGKSTWLGRQVRGTMPGQKTFSLGIFRYVPAKNGLKRSPVVERIRGTFDNPREAFERAAERCEVLEAEASE